MGQHRAVLRSISLTLALALALGAPLARVSLAHADEPGPSSEASDEREPQGDPRGASRPTFVWESGPAPELWAAPALSLSIGGLSLLAAIVLGQVGTANYHEAIDPATTQARAAELRGSLPDLELSANILYGVGAGLAAIGAIWLVALPLSQHRAPIDGLSALGPELHLSVGAGGITLGGSF